MNENLEKTSILTEFSLLSWQQILKEIVLGKGDYLETIFSLKGLQEREDQEAFQKFILSKSESIQSPIKFAKLIQSYPSNPPSSFQVEQIEKAYLFFVGPFSGSPSSVFGHTFLVFAKDRPMPLSPSFGYSALVRNTGFFSYLYKGLTGGFKGVVSKDELYMFLRKYSSIEDREIYIYEINKKKVDIKGLYKKLHQPKNLIRPYFFRTDNCATFIRRVLLEDQVITSYEDYPYQAVLELKQKGFIELFDYRPTIKTRLSALDEESYDYFDASYDFKVAQLERFPKLLRDAKKLKEKSSQDKRKYSMKKISSSIEKSHGPHRVKAWYGDEKRVGISYQHFYQGLEDPKVFNDYHDLLKFADIEIEDYKSLYLKKLNLLALGTNRNYDSLTTDVSSFWDLRYDHFRYESFEYRRGRIAGQIGLFKKFGFLNIGLFSGPSIGVCDSKFCAPLFSKFFIRYSKTSQFHFAIEVIDEFDPFRDEASRLHSFRTHIRIGIIKDVQIHLEPRITWLDDMEDLQILGGLVGYF